MEAVIDRERTGIISGGPETWPEYRRRVPVRAIRMPGPFTVETSNGTVSCSNGYLAVDARGFPYPIDALEFELIYDPVE